MGLCPAGFGEDAWSKKRPQVDKEGALLRGQRAICWLMQKKGRSSVCA
jgi:hypothetical protein